jgi:engulfment and cell motility protein 1
MEEPPDVATLVESLVADNESVRKYAVFKLQGLLGDPSFADAFIQGDGLLPLRQAVLDTTGNTQAYAFGSLHALLELDMGWDAVDGAVIEKVRSLPSCPPCSHMLTDSPGSSPRGHAPAR